MLLNISIDYAVSIATHFDNVIQKRIAWSHYICIRNECDFLSLISSMFPSCSMRNSEIPALNSSENLRSDSTIEG